MPAYVYGSRNPEGVPPQFYLTWRRPGARASSRMITSSLSLAVNRMVALPEGCEDVELGIFVPSPETLELR